MGRAPLGSYLVSHGTISEDALRHGLEQLADVHHATLGEVLVEMGVISERALDRIVRFGLEELGFEPPIGRSILWTLLLEHGLASVSELDAAERRLSRTRKRRLGAVLVDLHTLDRHGLAQALAARAGTRGPEA